MFQPLSSSESFLKKLLQGKKEFFTDLFQGGPAMDRNIVLLLVTVIIGVALYGLTLSTGMNVVPPFVLVRKIMTLIFVSTAIVTPSLYVFSMIRGTAFSLRQLLVLLVSYLVVVTIVLVGFLPIVWFFLFTSEYLEFPRIMNGALIAFSVIFGIAFLEKGFRVARDLLGTDEKKGRSGIDVLLIWAIVYAAVLIQMGMELSPFFQKG